MLKITVRLPNKVKDFEVPPGCTVAQFCAGLDQQGYSDYTKTLNGRIIDAAQTPVHDGDVFELAMKVKSGV